MRKPILKNLEFPAWLGKYWYFILFGLSTQIISILLPRSSSISGTKVAFCNYYITKFNIFNIHVDCDSQYFLLDSQDPMRLFRDQTPLQDRPLHTFLVYIASKVLGFIGIPSGPITYLGEDNIPQTYNTLNYGIFLVINVLILLVSIMLVLNVMLKAKHNKGKYFNTSIFLAILLISQNPVNREYFWTPHSQIFNLLVPAFLFYLVQKDFYLSRKRFFIILFLISASLLAYPTFTILLPVFFVITWKSLSKFYAILIPLSLAPKFLWPLAVNAAGGNYVDWPVVGHRRFVWILDSYNSKTLASDFQSNISAFLDSMPLLWVVITLIILSIGIYYLIGLRHTIVWTSRSHIGYAAFAFLTYLAGMILNGEYGPRFTTGVILLLSFLILNEIGSIKTKSRHLILAFSVAILVNFWYWVTNYTKYYGLG